jgi:hypothetical protein
MRRPRRHFGSPGRREAASHSPGIAVPSHAAGIDGYCVLSWSSPGRRLVGRRKVVLDFSPADHLIVKKLFLIEPPVDAARRRKVQDNTK